VRCHELIDQQLGEAIARDVDTGGAEDSDLAFVTMRYTKVERPAAKVEHEGQPGRYIRRTRRGDGLLHEADVAQAGQARGLLKTGPCTLFDLRSAHELDRPAHRRRCRSRAGELLDAFEDPREDHRDQVLEPALVAEHVRVRKQRVTQERLERLEEPSRRGGIDKDQGLDTGRLARIARHHANAELLVLALHGTARAVVREERPDRRMTDLRGAVAADVQHARQCVARDRIDRQQAHVRTIRHRDGAVGRAEVQSEPELAHRKRMRL